jgi:hypothetical protein
MNFRHLFIQRFEQLTRPERLRQLAVEHDWCQRTGKISPSEFLLSTVGQASALELTLGAQAGSLSEPVSRQAIDQRYNPQAVAFFKAAFQEALEATLRWRTDSTMTRALQEHFAAIRLFDSTQCSCSEALAKILPACGGSGSQAGIKVLLSYEYGAGQFQPLAVLPAKCSDQGLAGSMAQEVGRGELGIFDKGFYKAQALREIQERGGFFLTPCPLSVGLATLDSSGQPQTLEIGRALKASDSSCVEWQAVQLGKTETSRLGPVRLVAHRLPEESANRRRAALREGCRTQGRVPTQEALELAGWALLLTNASAQQLPAAAIGYLYRARWQIELVFKQCKSVLRLNVLVSRNRSRVQCEVWARLLNALLTFLWFQHTNAAALELHACEMSFAKVAKLLQQRGHTLVRTLFTARERLRSELASIWKALLKLGRKEGQVSRSTTWANLCTHWLNTIPGSRDRA